MRQGWGWGGLEIEKGLGLLPARDGRLQAIEKHRDERIEVYAASYSYEESGRHLHAGGSGAVVL